EKGFADGRATGVGHRGKALGRNVPTTVNLDGRAPYFWDGRAATLEEQALGPMTNPDEMAGDAEKVVSELSIVPEYAARFAAAFGDDGVSRETIGRAIASFERTLVSRDAPLDRYLGGDKAALSDAAVRGMNLFVGKGLCTKCHEGPQLTDNSFHN